MHATALCHLQRRNLTLEVEKVTASLGPVHWAPPGSVEHLRGQGFGQTSGKHSVYEPRSFGGGWQYGGLRVRLPWCQGENGPTECTHLDRLAQPERSTRTPRAATAGYVCTQRLLFYPGFIFGEPLMPEQRLRAFLRIIIV